jgi:hypothetical protein
MSSTPLEAASISITSMCLAVHVASAAVHASTGVLIAGPFAEPSGSS